MVSNPTTRISTASGREQDYLNKRGIQNREHTLHKLMLPQKQTTSSSCVHSKYNFLKAIAWTSKNHTHNAFIQQILTPQMRSYEWTWSQAYTGITDMAINEHLFLMFLLGIHVFRRKTMSTVPQRLCRNCPFQKTLLQREIASQSPKPKCCIQNSSNSEDTVFDQISINQDNKVT